MTRQNKENREDMYRHYGFRCIVCGKRATQAAHIIGDTHLNRKMYGNRIVDHELNILPTCNLAHNSAVDIGRIPSKLSAVVMILDSLDTEQEKREKLERLVADNIKGIL